MATLSWAELKKYDWRLDKFIEDVEKGVPFKMNSGSDKVLKFQNPKALAHLKSKGLQSEKWAYTGNILMDSSKKGYKLSDIFKSADYGGAGQNLGNVAEGVLNVAVAARFINKGKKITAEDAYSVRSKLTGSGMIRKAEFSSANKLSSVKDEVDVVIELNESDMANFLKNKYPQLMNAAVIFANSKNVRDLADVLYNNNQFNFIDIKSLGISGGLRTKIDTFVLVDGQEVSMNYSLKAGDVKQFGQFAGHTWEAQENLWNAFGIDVPTNIKSEFMKKVGEHDPGAGFRSTFKSARDVFNRKPDSAQVAKAIVFFATTPDTVQVDLVQLKKDKVVVYRFGDAVNIIKEIPLVATYDVGASNLPTLRFETENGDRLVKVRVKKSGKGKDGRPYHRCIVEKEPYMAELLSETLM
jgi:hypothetical protein